MYEERTSVNFKEKNQIELGTLRKDSLIQITIEKMKKKGNNKSLFE